MQKCNGYHVTFDTKFVPQIVGKMFCLSLCKIYNISSSNHKFKPCEETRINILILVIDIKTVFFEEIHKEFTNRVLKCVIRMFSVWLFVCTFSRTWKSICFVCIFISSHMEAEKFLIKDFLSHWYFSDFYLLKDSQYNSSTTNF